MFGAHRVDLYAPIHDPRSLHKAYVVNRFGSARFQDAWAIMRLDGDITSMFGIKRPLLAHKLTPHQPENVYVERA